MVQADEPSRPDVQPSPGERGAQETGEEHKPSPGPGEHGEAEVRPRPPIGLRDPAHSFPIVGIGCSAGGLEPLRQFLGGFELGCGLAFVAIQHLEPSSHSYMADLLGRATSLPVDTILDGMQVEPDHVYVLPPNRYVALRAHDLQLVEPLLSRGRRMPINHFLHSLAEVQQERGVCVLLSGTGDDGTSGARAVREHGGLVVVQDPEEAEYSDMPRNAAATGMVDFVLSVDQMPEKVTKYAGQSGLRSPYLPSIEGDHLEGILAHVLARTRYDFRGYKRNTLVRRIYRRMALNQLDSSALYLEHLLQNPREAELLRNDLLIGVTSFFREPDSWDELRRTALHDVIAHAEPDAILRAWVPGCSTGEEAYSLAILLLEEMAAQQRVLPLQIFASDIDEAALETARHGVYAASIVADVPDPLREMYFRREGSRYRCDKRIREPIVFSMQNLISDPPFSRLDLVSCRNLLIYLESELQKKVAYTLAFSLKPGGWLFLGKSDSLSGREGAFRLVSKRHRIYLRRAASALEVGDLRVPAPPRLGTPRDLSPQMRATGLDVTSRNAMLEHFGACILLVDSRGKILHFAGNATRFLTLPAGEPDLDLLAMAREKLSLKLRAALKRTIGEKAVVRIDKVPIDHNGTGFTARATLRLLAPGGRREQLVAVVLEEVPEPPPRPDGTADEDESVIKSLEDEIRSLREELQGSYDEFAAGNEELKAASEEVMSMNEELQSANEELETSKEEIQSINEELITVNNQLNEKILALGTANDDLANLFNATHVATIFLDNDLTIKRFTPRATELLNLIETDIGRPLAHISQTFGDADATKRAQKVLADLVPVEEEIGTAQGDWFTMRIFPYRTLDNRIDGVVLTFSDVTRLKQVEAYAQSVMSMVSYPLLVLDRRFRIVAMNREFRREFDLHEPRLRGRPLLELDAPRFAPLLLRLEQAVTSGEIPEPFEIEYTPRDGGELRRLIVDLRPLEGPALLLSIRRRTPA